MTMCPDCDKVFDESEYAWCPYCSGEIEEEHGDRYYKKCPICDGIMYWEDYWLCTNCGKEIKTKEDDYDGIIEL